MSDTVVASLIILGFTVTGIFLGAWFAARGFEKSLIQMMDDPDAPWNKEDEE